MSAELRIDHGDLAVLDHIAFDSADRFSGVVGDDDVGSDLFAMIVSFAIQCNFQINFSCAEGKSFADQRAG